MAEVPNERVPDDFRQYLGARERILLIAYGDVKAGFDLSKLRQEDLWTDGSRVTQKDFTGKGIDLKYSEISHTCKIGEIISVASVAKGIGAGSSDII